MAYRQYTHCVQPADYVDPLPRTDDPVEIIGAILDTALGGWLPDAILGCDYLLGGKLVCLGGDECAIGHITHFEPPSEKSFPANLDNDFSLNILLAPQGLGTFAFHTDNRDNYVTAENAVPQGRLLQEQLDMPIPHEDEVDVPSDYGVTLHPLRHTHRFFGYYSVYPDSKYLAYDPSHSPFQVPGSDGPPFPTPALHLEAEGDRVCQVCQVIQAFTGGPLGKAICSRRRSAPPGRARATAISTTRGSGTAAASSTSATSSWRPDAGSTTPATRAGTNSIRSRPSSASTRAVTTTPASTTCVTAGAGSWLTCRPSPQPATRRRAA
jgi:hypothetical protein